MRRIFVPAGAFLGDIINITDKEDILYLSGVLRMKVGDELYVSDGVSRACEGRIREIGKGGILLDVIREVEIEEEAGVRITLYQGLPKGAKMDEIVRKATELGVHRIVPVVTARVIPRNDGEHRNDRWRKIAEEAARQSQRGRIPEVEDVITLEEAVEEVKGQWIASSRKGRVPRNDRTGYDLVVVLFELEEGRTLKEALRLVSPTNIGVFVGPEGGFEVAEVERLVSAGAVSATLGETILRTETAGPAAIAMIRYEYDL